MGRGLSVADTVRLVKRLALTVLVTLAVGYLVICGLLFFAQRKILFPAPTQLAAVREGMERVEIPGGTFLLWKNVKGGGPVVVHFHGNGEQVGSLSWLAEAWAERGVSFAAIEYPGYPGAAGAPSEDSIIEASEAALTHLTGAMKIDRSRLVLEGQSIGTGVAMNLAAKDWGTKLILLSPYTSLPAVAAKAFPWLPTGMLMRDRFDSASRAAGIKVPTWIVHGTADAVIPLELGQSLSKSIAGATFLEVTGAGHNDLWDRESTQEAIFTFVTARR